LHINRDAEYSYVYVLGFDGQCPTVAGDRRIAEGHASMGLFDIARARSNLSPGKGPGRWKPVARLNGLDLGNEDVDGDEMTLGINGYVNPFMCMSANYVSVLDVEGGAHDGDEPSVFQVHAQVAY
jgi:phosphate-selective porin OprO/OprP